MPPDEMPERLPPEFIEQVRDLESSYLSSDDPRRQSGFSGGARRWKEERGPIIEAIDRDGTIIDVGCANGYLLESLCAWATLEKRWHLVPYGVDINPRLVVESMRRWPGVADHFWIADAWDFAPPVKFDFVYSIVDVVPGIFLPRYTARLLDRYVKPGGRLILGHYGSRSRGEEPINVADVLDDFGFPVAGSMQGGKMTGSDRPVARFAWLAN